jgi:hypothetical protein
VITLVGSDKPSSDNPTVESSASSTAADVSWSISMDIDIDRSPLIPPLKLNALFSAEGAGRTPAREALFGRPTPAPTALDDGTVAVGDDCLPFADLGRENGRLDGALAD